MAFEITSSAKYHQTVTRGHHKIMFPLENVFKLADSDSVTIPTHIISYRMTLTETDMTMLCYHNIITDRLLCVVSNYHNYYYVYQ